MTKLKVVSVIENGLKAAKHVEAEILDGINDEAGITKSEFHALLDKASRPIEKPAPDKEGE